jgi:hypothetical protein
MKVQWLLFSVLTLMAVLSAVWFKAALDARNLKKLWDQCQRDAAQIVQGVKMQYPGCEGARCALTLEPDLRQSSSAYKNISFEDFLDVLDRVTPEETPIYSLAGREMELGNTEFAWNVDSWPGRNGALGVSDGEAAASSLIRNRAANVRKMGNIGQGFRRPYGAGWIANRVPRVAGMKKGNLVADAEADAQILLKQDMDSAFGSLDQTAYQDTGSATGSLGAGLRKLIDYDNRYTAASAYAVGKPTDLHYAPTAACLTGTLAAAFNRAAMKTVAKALRTSAQTAGDYTLVAGLDLRQAVTDLTEPVSTSSTGATGSNYQAYGTQIRIFTQAMQDNELGQSIDVIRTDWGRFAVIDTRGIGTTTTDSTGGAVASSGDRSTRAFVEKAKCGYIIKKGMFAKRWGVPIYSERLSNDGGGEKYDCKCYAGLVVYNPQYFAFLELT